MLYPVGQEWESAASANRAVWELRSELSALRRELKAAEASLRRELKSEARDIRTAVWAALAFAVEAIIFAAAVVVGILK